MPRLILESLEDRIAPTASLLKDIGVALGNPAPAGMTAVGSTLYFAANDGPSTYVDSSPSQLGKWDGTNFTLIKVGTYAKPSISDLTALGSNLYFRAYDGTGYQLWKYNGSNVSEIMVGSYANPSPNHLTAVGNNLYFTASDSTGSHLWEYNGSNVSEIQVGTASSPNPSNLMAVGNTLYFTAYDGTGNQLWQYDGSNLSEIKVGTYGSPSPSDLTVLGSTLYFMASDGTGDQLWKYDGSNVSEIMVGTNSNPTPQDLTAMGGNLYFRAYDGTSNQLWKYDGNNLSEITVGTSTNPYPSNLTAVGSTLYFSANDGSSTQLWKYDGSNLSEIKVGTYISPSPQNLIAVGGKLYFTASDGAGTQLWQYDGSNLSEIKVGTYASPNPYGLTALGSILYFGASNGTGSMLWSVDTTSAILQQVNLETSLASSWSGGFTQWGTNVYFSASDGLAGDELWVTDGTTNGTTRVSDLNPGSASSFPYDLTVMGSNLYFGADDGIGYQLWKYDGSNFSEIKAGTYGNPHPFDLTVMGGNLYFGTSDSTGYQLWKYDGSNLSEIMDIVSNSANLYALTVWGGNLYFGAWDGAGYQLWKYDGSNLTEIKVGTFSNPSPQGTTVMGSNMYFTAHDGTGYQLWKYDGSNLTEIKVGTYSSPNPNDLTVMGNTLYFNAFDGTGNQLWKYDGSNLTEVKVGTYSSPAPGNLTVVGSTLYFSAYDGVGTQLWKYDGSNLTEVKVATYGNPSTTYLMAVGSNLYFSASSGTGNQLWMYDGSNLSEISINPNGASNPSSLSAIGNALFLSANDGIHGNEPWIVGRSTPTVPTPVVPTNAVYNGQPQGATVGDVIGDNNTDLGPPTLTYYAGTYTLANLPSSGGSSSAPINAGNYTVVASYAGNLAYTPAYSLTTYSIGKAKLIVSSTADDGSPGTLRYAITQANTGNFAEIDFAIGAVGSAQTIQLTSALPTLTASGVFINGLSQGGSGNTKRLITLDGTGAGSSSDGLILQGSNWIVSGLILSHFTNNGIEVQGSNNTIGGTATGAGNVLSGNTADGILIDSGVSGVAVQGNYIGTNTAGTAALANSIGIEDAGNNNTIGGSVVGVRNIISGNTNDGVLIDSAASGNVVSGNILGLTASGSAALANSGNGLEVQGTSNIIGGPVYYARNFIAGNSKDGILLGSSASGNLVLDHFIGLNISGTVGVGNLNGVEIAGTNNTLGSTVSGGINFISGNTNDGVLIDSTATGNLLLSNDVGTDYTGQKSVANSIGIEVAGAGNTIGGTVSAARNIISGNSSDGVKLDSSGSSTLVLGNSIGINVVDAALANGGNGLNILSTTNTIGSTASGSRNVISGNSGDGVLIASGASGNQVLGSYVGLNIFGSAALGNGTNGIEVGGNSNTIGGTTSAARNVISGNIGDGVKIDTGVSGIQVQGNYIGLNYAGNASIGNNGNGIEDAGRSNILGGSVSGARNVVSGNIGDGILLDSTATGDAVQGNFLGLNSNANAALANSGNGLEVQGTNSTIGGTVLAARNYIAGNSKDGLLLSSSASGNLVLDNFIGIDISGTHGVANLNGVEIAGSNNTIGGTNSAGTNVLSANKNDGILIDSTATNNLIQDNDVGTDFSGQKALANSIGIEVAGVGNTLGGTVTAARNLVSGNSSDGVKLDSSGSGTLLLGNSIGINSVDAALGNGGNGLNILSISNTIGGTTSGSRNVISGNSGDGVLLASGASGNQVLGNYIGTNIFGKAALGNSTNGIEIGGNGNTIGGTAWQARNVISGNTGDGVKIDTGVSGIQVQGNYIGLNSVGTGGIGNNGNGIEDAGSGNILGGSVSGARNVVSGNGGDGILLDSSATADAVQGNFLGLNSNANAALANSGNGLEVQGTNNTIGGSVYFARNFLSGNANDGLLLGSSASGNLALNNFIGVDISGTHGVANLNGVEIAGSNNTLGGTVLANRNIISGNSNDGMLLDSTAANNFIQGNDVGTDYTGQNVLANSGNGVEIAGSNNMVGGSASGAGNVIANNGKDGVLVSAGSGNTIRRNSIYNNAGPGISLSSGANNNIVAPTLSSATLSGSTLTVQGSFAVPTANVSYVLEFFASPSGDAEGKIYLGSLTVKPTATGTQNFTFTTTTTVTGTYPLITATLTDNTGDTSAFSSGVVTS